MKRLIFGTLLTVLVTLVGAGWWFRGELSAAWKAARQPLAITERSNPRPNPERYAELKEEIERWRKSLASEYSRARSPAEREAVIDDAQVFLETALPDLMACWLGTRWDFNGTAEVPGEGRIACGYFVATVLRDAGFRIDRYKLARQPSQNILRTFLPREELHLRVGAPYQTYATEIRSLEGGVRVIGLDTHVAFLIVRPDGFRFIHSSGSRPWCVVDESEDQAEVLRASNYRVQGSLTGNREVLRRWLAGERFEVKES